MKNFLPSFLIFYLLLFCASSVSNSVFAQGSTTSGMNGIVTDQNGEALIGATVIAVHQPTGTEYGVVTNVEGRFYFRNMRPGGPYTVRVTYVGYENFVKEGINLNLGQTYEFNARLNETATELQEVQVVAGRGTVLDGNRTGVETNVGEEQIDALPTASRNLADFVRLSPQASITETGDGPAITIAGQNNRFNSIYIDGAVNNDVFGLAGSGTNGGQSGISPISIDAIEQFNISVSPYDVTLGGFTGGSINAVTRSGTNEVKGSVYYFFRNENLAGGTPSDTRFDEDKEAEDEEGGLGEFVARTYGFRVGGPIVKNKVFFFLNGEIQRDEVPQPFDIESYRREGGVYSLDQLESVRQLFITRYGYDPGGFRNNIREQNGDKLLGKIDLNISANHKLSLRHSYTYAEEIEANRSTATEINFLNNAEFFPSTTNSTALELNSNLGTNTSNKLIVGYTRVRDDRDPLGQPFPKVLINETDSTRIQLNIGAEEFSVGNLLNQDVVTLTNNFTLFSGKHTFTFGTHNEYYKIYNLFLRENFGVYTYDSLGAFINNLGPSRYQRTYVIYPEVDVAQGDEAESIAAQFEAIQLGLYVQDEIQLQDNLKITAGVRVDIPTFLDDPVGNQVFNESALPAMDAQYSVGDAATGTVPDAQFLISPRFGFNFNPKRDATLQIRGGIGIFTGRIPFVWPGGSFTNNGVFLADIDVRNPKLEGSGIPLPFSADPTDQYIANDIIGAGISGGSQIDLFSENFKFPQVMRTSLAVDYQLPLGLIGSLEGIYTKDINSIYYRNINLARADVVVGQQPDGTIVGPDNRPVYTNGAIDPRFGRVLYATNTNKGYSYTLTAQVQRPFRDGWFADVSYTFGRSKSVFNGGSSQNSSNWRNTYAVDKNDVQLAFSDFDLGSRIIASVSYRKEYAENFASQLSLFYTGQSGDRFSYTYNRASGGNRYRTISGNNLSGREFNDPIYIPRNFEESFLIDIPERRDAQGNITQPFVSAQEQWERLNAFIEDDPYLRNHRGDYAEANAARLPFEHVVDIKFVQDFFVEVNGKRNTLQLSIDIFNFTNLLNDSWGNRYFINFGNYSLVNFEGFRNPNNGDFTPRFTYRNTSDPKDIGQLDDSGIISSRWQGQVGIRYIFN